MKDILSNIKIAVNEKLYVKNPESSDLGKKIIENSIFLIDEIGFDKFTFKKLGTKIGSNESSIYRYFDSKHKLLLYLSSWYWCWMEYRMVFATANIENPMEKLKKAIEIVTERIEDDTETAYVDEAILNRIIILEFTKTFLTKEVDIENKEGFFLVYKAVINRLIAMITAVNADFKFAKSLASSIVEGALHQHFLGQHLKTITNCDDQTSPSEFYLNIISGILQKPKHKI